jgi:hypothetical protein
LSREWTVHSLLVVPTPTFPPSLPPSLPPFLPPSILTFKRLPPPFPPKPSFLGVSECLRDISKAAGEGERGGREGGREGGVALASFPSPPPLPPPLGPPCSSSQA